MGWWSDLKTKKELGDARRSMQSARSPYSIGKFIDRCIDKNRFDLALEEAEKGNLEFPHSEALTAAYKRLIRAVHADDLKTGRNEVRKAPGPKAYYKLARLYKKMRDLDQAIELARKGVELYPNFEGNYIVLADIRYERFQRDMRATDGLQAIDLFEKAVDLNRENYRLLFQLAEIYSAIGARTQALEKAEMILEFAPDDRNAVALIDKLRKMKPSNFIEGFERAVVLGPKNELLAAHPGSGSDNREFAETFKRMFEAAIECSLRMDISTFEKGLFDAEDGFVYLLVLDQLKFAVMCGEKTKKNHLLGEVHRFVEHDLYL